MFSEIAFDALTHKSDEPIEFTRSSSTIHWDGIYHRMNTTIYRVFSGEVMALLFTNMDYGYLPGTTESMDVYHYEQWLKGAKDTKPEQPFGKPHRVFAQRLDPSMLYFFNHGFNHMFISLGEKRLSKAVYAESPNLDRLDGSA